MEENDDNHKFNFHEIGRVNLTNVSGQNMTRNKLKR